MNTSLRLSMMLVLALHVSSLYAATTGQIRGVITEETTGKPVAGVTVAVIGTNFGAFTDPDGKFSVLRVEPGTYIIKASAIGYKATETVDVVVRADLRTHLNVELFKQPSDTDLVIVITEGPVIVESFRSIDKGGLTSDSISRQPVTTIDDLLTQVAGVVMDKPPGNPAARGSMGSCSRGLAYVVDSPPPPPISRQEVQAMMPLYTTYFRIWRALANDDLSVAQQEFVNLGKVAESIEFGPYGEYAVNRFVANRQSIIDLAETGSSADSIEDIRKHFRTLSRTIASVHLVFGHLGDNYYYRVSCSVFGSSPCYPRAYWFQESDDVRNPLYGGEYLCDGLVEDSLKPTDAAGLPVYIVEGE